MYDDERWTGLRNQFRETFFGIYGITSIPLLSLTVFAGLASLKLPACLPSAPHASLSTSDKEQQVAIPSLAASPPVHFMNVDAIDPSLSVLTDPTPVRGHPEHPQRNIDCPSCGQHLGVLARQAPYSHHVNSTMVCRISGEVMDDENYPMAFPNGYVYSYKVCTVT